LEPTKTEVHVLNLGAGVQSTTLYLMFMRGEITPNIDYAIFADVQEEPEAVYRHLNWLQSLNGPPIFVRTKGKLGDDLARGVHSTGQRFASIPAFTLRPDGTEGRTRRQCSMEYKVAVIETTIKREILDLKPRARTPKGVTVHQYFGISMDEGGRARRIRDNMRENCKWASPHFPLIERFMTRANCLDWLARFGPPHEVPRSACTFCPFHSDYEWDRLKREDPVGWARAVYIDNQLRIPGNIVNRNMDQQLFLHRSCVPLELVQLDTRPDPRKAQLSINFSAECMGMCGL
jgi:hypothetical protein